MNIRLIYILQTSFSVTEALLDNLNYYKAVTVSGDVGLKDLVGKCKPFKTEKKKKQTKSKEATVDETDVDETPPVNFEEDNSLAENSS